MNYIQRAWLYVLKPVNYLINEKLANKSGILGRIGRFWSLGPREFGYHPTSKFLAYFNANFVHSMIWTMMHYPILKNMTARGHLNMRPFEMSCFFGYISLFATCLCFILPANAFNDDNDDITFFKKKMDQSPLNSFDHRLSAHYTEINDYYTHEMMRKIIERTEKVVAYRATLPEQVKLTRYARPGYKYIQRHSKYVPEEQ